MNWVKLQKIHSITQFTLNYDELNWVQFTSFWSVEIRRYVMKHIQWLNEILIDIERINCIIFEKKSQFCCEELRVIKFVCDVKKRHSNTTKIIKILDWFFCQDAVDVRELIEICVFYRIFITDFAFIA